MQKGTVQRGENYFNDAILYKEEQKDNSEADSELDDGSNKVSIEMNPPVIGLSDININPNTDDEGIWVLNKDIDFEYVLSSSDGTSETNDVIIKKLNRILILHIPFNQCQ